MFITYKYVYILGGEYIDISCFIPLFLISSLYVYISEIWNGGNRNHSWTSLPTKHVNISFHRELMLLKEHNHIHY